MLTTEEILPFARSNRQKIRNLFYNKIHAMTETANGFRKHELNALFLLTIETPSDLCRFLQTPFVELERLINSPVYRHYTIRKKKGGDRQICAPEKHLMLIQKRLNYFLQAYYLWIKPDEVHGFVVNPHYLGTHCNILENASVHTGRKYVLNVDMKDFFPGISARRVKQVFTSGYFDFKENMANALTFLTTYEGRLPIGAPTSPVISNFTCFQLDIDMENYAGENGWSYTRYADDLTFSSNTTISSSNISDIICVIERNGFEVNRKKLRLRSSNHRQTVTGLTVNDKVNVNRKLLRRIRAMLHDATVNDIDQVTRKHFKLQGEVGRAEKARFIRRLDGYINFVGQIRGRSDTLYLRQRSIFDSLFLSDSDI